MCRALYLCIFRAVAPVRPLCVCNDRGHPSRHNPSDACPRSAGQQIETEAAPVRYVAELFGANKGAPCRAPLASPLSAPATAKP
jgi:hypothetical protein